MTVWSPQKSDYFGNGLLRSKNGKSGIKKAISADTRLAPPLFRREMLMGQDRLP